MPITDENMSTNWVKIRQGVKDAELLISQKRYNLSMVKCRQTLEYMIRDLCDKAMISSQSTGQDLSALVDALYTNRWISKTTCEHYHKIRMLGNKAVHEGSENAYDANQAYQLLRQEAETFYKTYHSSKQKSAQKQHSGQAQSRTRAAGSARSRRRAPEGFSLNSTDVLRILILVFAVILIVVLIRILRPSGPKTEETSAPSTEAQLPEEPSSQEETTAAPETMAETTPAAVFRTNDYLNVRAEPSTTGSRLGVLDPDTVVEYVGEYDSEWAIIMYEGSEAYVASRYLSHD